MKKFDFIERRVPTEAERLGEINEAKPDAASLPHYSLEIPQTSTKKTRGNMTTVAYTWKNLSETPMIKIQELVYEQNAGLDALYKLPVRDGVDKAAFTHRDNSYVIRKIVKTIAQSVYQNAKKAAGLVENVVGYMKTVLGNYYALVKLENQTWTFDGELKMDSVKLLNKEKLGEGQKDRLFEEISERLSELHAKDLSLGFFSLNSIVLYNNGVLLADTRLLKETRKRSFLVNEYSRALATLVSSGFGGSEDVACAVRYYVTANPQPCHEWYREETRKDATGDEEIAELLESKI